MNKVLRLIIWVLTWDLALFTINHLIQDKIFAMNLFGFFTTIISHTIGIWE